MFSALFSFFCALTVIFHLDSVLTGTFPLILCVTCFSVRLCPECLRHGGAAEVPPTEPGSVAPVLPLQSPAPPAASSPPPPSSPAPSGAPRPAVCPAAGLPQPSDQLHHPASINSLHLLHCHHHQPPQGRPPDQAPGPGSGATHPAGAPLPVLLQPGPGPVPVRDHP